ncbi:MAG TPA: mevalonate kinase [Anaerolineaceae bacterium]|nr:mevalonate kinase [Anaerolineaceae bacterium]
MPIIPASACAKTILFGEHAVVYDLPAVALPISTLRVKAIIEPGIGLNPGTILVKIPSLSVDSDLLSLPKDHPVVISIQATLDSLGIKEKPTFRLQLGNNFPLGAGLGGSAAIAVAIARGLSAFLGHPLDQAEVNAIAYLAEQSAHGKPSGIDNTVISLEQPIYFQRGKNPEILKPGAHFSFLVADTGISKRTQEVVGDLFQKRLHNDEIQNIMISIGKISQEGRKAFISDNLSQLGSLMDENQALLEMLAVSSPELEILISVARSEGALGAKLTGGGRGGCVLALLETQKREAIERALLNAGAKQTFYFEIGPKSA